MRLVGALILRSGAEIAARPSTSALATISFCLASIAASFASGLPPVSCLAEADGSRVRKSTPPAVTYRLRMKIPQLSSGRIEEPMLMADRKMLDD
jgi:hypothetical protein